MAVEPTALAQRLPFDADLGVAGDFPFHLAEVRQHAFVLAPAGAAFDEQAQFIPPTSN
jgi:hypothetical protein